ncbi:cGMP-dependent 3',5'-cyclic phosphodiesterase, partial [Geodia barretti]
MCSAMGLTRRWKLQPSTLAKFVLMVKRSYRDPPYHNWYHALSVAHFCYVLHQRCDNLSFLTDLEVLALFFSCLCHDIDHRGTNNSFQISSKSVLASLYSSEGSVMERHHFS